MNVICNEMVTMRKRKEDQRKFPSDSKSSSDHLHHPHYRHTKPATKHSTHDSKNQFQEQGINRKTQSIKILIDLEMSFYPLVRTKWSFDQFNANCDVKNVYFMLIQMQIFPSKSFFNVRFESYFELR